MSVIYDGTQESQLMKNVLSETLAQLVQEDPNVFYLDADLMSCINTKKWADEHPENAVNCGIAEANMIGIAAGLSSMGYKPFAHSFGTFASRRCFDQVFLSCGYAGNDIVILGSDPGICAEYNGGTHMPLEDVALYRSIPDATVIEVSDAAMFRKVLRQAKDRKGINYIRFGRKLYTKIYSEDHDIQVGKAEILREGDDVTIIANGIMLQEALLAAKHLPTEGLQAAVLDLHTIQPIDADTICEFAQRTGCVVTAENHNIVGGTYSAVCEVLAKTCPVPVMDVGVKNSFGEVGSLDYLKKRFGLNCEQIVQKAKQAVALKGKNK